MIKCEHCGNFFINKACVTKHLNNKRCPNYVPPPTYKELQTENADLKKELRATKLELAIAKDILKKEE